MKERPILFSGPMVRAILEGRKTQTRRIVKQVQHWQHCGKDIMEWGLSDCYTEEDGTHWLDIQTDVDDNSHNEIKCPFGQPGDRLWVRETWGKTVEDTICYRADEPGSIVSRWRPSIHMPRWASRITLEVTGIRVERLQEVSCDDAIAEGIEREYAHNQYLGWKNYLWHGHFGEYGLGNKWSDQWDHQYSTYRTENPVGSYSSLWEFINGPGSWDANPWVWVIEFRRINP